jgi:TonB family protein
MPHCAVPYKDATVVHQVTPGWPEFARRVPGTRQVAIAVEIAPNGKVRSLRVLQSSGDVALDTAAMRAAQQSTYAPKIVDCKPRAGTFIFRVTFSSN